MQPSERTRVRRLPERGVYDEAIVHGILDEAPICHVGLVDDGGQPFVIPTIHARRGSRLYLHGSPASRLLRTAKSGVPLCVTATLLDGLVLARSAFHHSMNYRSVVVLGPGRVVDDPAEKLDALEAIVEHVAAGRWEGSRRPSDHELRSTLVVGVEITEASAKVRAGPPKDDDEDLASDHWAGVVPLRLVPGTPLAAPDLRAGVGLPDHVAALAQRAE